MKSDYVPIQKIIHVPTIKLSRGMKGSYGWEIRLCGEDIEALQKDLVKIDDEMQKQFPSPQEHDGGEE